MNGFPAATRAPDTSAGTGCWHCGQPLDAATSTRGTVRGRDRTFCCPGCAGAAALVEALGCAGYYDRREGPISVASRVDHRRHDAPEALEATTERMPDGRRTAELVVPDVHCAACAWLIENALERRLGVRARVNVARQHAELLWDPQAVPLSAVLDLLAALGYPAAPARSEAGAGLLRRGQRELLVALAVSGIGAMQTMMLSLAEYLDLTGALGAVELRLLRFAQLFLTTLVVFVGARPFLHGAARALAARRLDMNVPVALAVLSAYAGGIVATVDETVHPYFDSICMFTFLLLLGRWLERSVTQRLLATPHLAPATSVLTVEAASGRPGARLPAGQLQPGDVFLLPPGERLPVDAVVLSGTGTVDLGVVTGEAKPQPVAAEQWLEAGTVNLEQPLVLRCARNDATSYVARLGRLGRAGSEERAAVVRITDRLAGVFVGLVLAVAAVTFLVWLRLDPDRAGMAALTVLIVSCPCALSLAVPTALSATALGLARMGLRLHDADAIPRLARIRHVVFDKTGTLTHPRAASEAEDAGLDAITAGLLRASGHPLAEAFPGHEARLPDDVRVHRGEGVEGTLAGRTWRLGRPAFAAPHAPADGSRLVLARDGEVLARYTVDEALDPSARTLVQALRRLGCEAHLFSGDRKERVLAVGRDLSIDDAEGDLTPEHKLERLRALPGEAAFVGDGLNDIPALGRAAVGIAAPGSPASAARCADAVLEASVVRLPAMLELCRRTRSVMRQNSAWALAYNAVTIPLAACALITPWMAAIGMTGSSLIVAGNAARLARTRPAREPARASSTPRRAPVASS